MTNITYYFPVEVMLPNSDQKSLLWESKEQNLPDIIIDKNMKLDTSKTLQEIRK